MLGTLRTVLGQQNIDINEEQSARIDRFYDLLMEKNRVMDLTNITEPREVALRHMADSLFLLKCADFEGKKVIDIGTGAGFPGMPLLMYDPDMDITMLDSTAKRIDFINETMDKMGGFENARAVAMRAEDGAAKAEYREQYDIVVSRAVAPLDILAELCIPFLKPGGVFLAMKSDNEAGEREIADALFAIKEVGGALDGQTDYQLAADCPKRKVVIIKKVRNTPEKYPRAYAKIKAKPLRSKQRS